VTLGKLFSAVIQSLNKLLGIFHWLKSSKQMIIPNEYKPFCRRMQVFRANLLIIIPNGTRK